MEINTLSKIKPPGFLAQAKRQKLLPLVALINIDLKVVNT